MPNPEDSVKKIVNKFNELRFLTVALLASMTLTASIFP